MSEFASKRRSPKSKDRPPAVDGRRNDKKRSAHESAVVQDRIKQWQAQGAAQARDPDTISIRSFPQSEIGREPNACREIKDTQTIPHNRVSQWVHQDNQQWTRERRRSQQQKTNTNDNCSDPERSCQQELTEKKTPEYSRDKRLHSRNVDISRAEREERRRRRREARVRASVGHDLATKGTRASVRPTSQPRSDQSLDEVLTHAAPSRDRAASATQSPTELDFIDHDTPVPKSKYADTLGREHLAELDDTRSRKHIILGKTREILTGRNNHTIVTSNRVPSIQAWLEDQTDLITEKEAPRAPETERTAKTSKFPRSTRKRHRLDPTVVGDPNKIWEAVGVPQITSAPLEMKAQRAMRREQRRVSRENAESQPLEHRQFSFEVSENASKGEVIASASDHPDRAPALRRRGVKSSRDKESAGLAWARSKANTPEKFSAAQSSPTAVHGAPKLDTSSAPQSPLKDQTSNGIDNGCVSQTTAANGVQRKLTTHDHLLSVLSLPQARKVARSVRSHRDLTNTRSNEQVLDDLVRGMQQEEVKYTRELRTLVEGVTPVLLDSLLSKKNAAVATHLFSDGATDSTKLTRSIIDMATAVEQLKNLHSRIPLQDTDSLLSWGLRAHFVYSKYVKAWRLGFQGVIVNLAPLSDSEATPLDILERDLNGDVVDAAGERIDVAYLQKRPLIRVKKLSKLYTTIQNAQADNEQAVRVAAMFADLTELAKRRHNEELGRIEDETAATVDISRARDVKNLAPAPNVQIDRTRKVRARDSFDMTIYHSTGQRMDCRVELVLRDDVKEDHNGGDVLICQQEGAGKWLLFAPISLSKISARRGESVNDLVIMVRGVATIAQEWFELLALTSDDPGAVTDWVHMLGSSPLPPKLNKTPTFAEGSSVPKTTDRRAVVLSAASSAPLSASALSSLPTNVDIPIGEPSEIGHRQHPRQSQLVSPVKRKSDDRALPILSLGGGLVKKTVPDQYQKASLTIPSSQPHRTRLATTHTSGQSTASELTNKESMLSGAQSMTSGPSSTAPTTSSVSSTDMSSGQRYPLQGTRKRSSVIIGKPSIPEEAARSSREPVTAHELVQAKAEKARQYFERLEKQQRGDHLGVLAKTSGSVIEPDEDAVLQHRPYQPSKISSPYSTSLTNAIRDQWVTMSGGRKKELSPTKVSHDQFIQPGLSNSISHGQRIDLKFTDDRSIVTARQASPVSSARVAHSGLTIGQKPIGLLHSLPQAESHPHFSQIPLLTREHDAASSDSESQSSSDDDTDATSEMSDRDGSELKDQFTPLVSIGDVKLLRRSGRPLPSLPTSGTQTLQPSDSASQGPYCRAPPPSAHPAWKKKRTIATVCSWSEKGVWQPVQDDECSVMVAPGLIQVFAMTEAHSQPMGEPDSHNDEANPSKEVRPLVEYELTPIVPLRRGTALDITIRSPPTANSQLQTTSNVMFRSRSVDECEKLYNMINWARCNNPTYASLARARAEQPRVSFAVDVSPSKSRSWFSFGAKSRGYRASSKPPSSMGDTLRSEASASSALSALRRFGKDSPFSLKRSSIVRKPSAGALESLYSSGSGTQPNSGSSTPVPSQAGYIPGKDGPNVPQTSAEAANGGGMVNNMKIRLFSRRGQGWEAMGQCGLTVLPAVVKTVVDSRAGSVYGSPVSTPQRVSAGGSTMPPSAMRQSQQFRLPSSGNTPHRIHGDGREKRLLITKWKKPETVMLDEMLAESCFEKVMQTGIAVKVWKEEEHVRDIGGVMNGRNRTYMIQFMTSAEAEWVFGMVGTYRYGNRGDAV